MPERVDFRLIATLDDHVLPANRRYRQSRLQLFEPVKARCVINEQLSLALLADIVSLEEDIDRAVEAVSVRDIRAINPALVAELFDGEREQLSGSSVHG